MSQLNKLKDNIQQKALLSHDDFDGFSTLAMATGVGKSRCAVLKSIKIVKQNPDARIFLAVPTVKLRDENWKNEFQEWGALDIFENNVVKSCYVSMHKYINQNWDFVICDEFHHITDNCFPFFFENEISSVMGLTATPPTDKEKLKIINTIAPISYVYSLNQARKDRIVADFSIDVIFTNLDDKQKVVLSGPKTKQFKTTESASYEYWDKKFIENKEQIKELESQLYGFGFNEYNCEKFLLDNKNLKSIDYFKNIIKNDFDKIKNANTIYCKREFLKGSRFRIIGARRKILLDSLNKERIANRFLSQLFEINKRYLVFCGSIAQSSRLLGENTFSSSTDSKAYDKFLNEELNVLGVINCLNEGANIKNLDEALVIQISGQELHIIQRLGRIIRVRDNHTGRITILCVRNSQDEVWLNSALKSFDKDLIKYWTEEEYFDAFKK